MPKQINKSKGRVIPFERDGEFFLRLGSQRLERNNLVEAIGNYHRARQREPENVEVQLAIAEVLTEMHRYEQSNKLLFPILSTKDSPAECFFGIACNFLGMQEFSHAHDSLESYLALDPEGEYVGEALDMLDIIEDGDMLYSMPGVQQPDEREAMNACMRGRRLLEFGRMKEAITLLKEAAEKWPEIHFVRNNLALAHFCNKDYEQAMSSVRAVLEEAPQNVQAHCNLLLFLHAARDEEGVTRELAFLQAVNTQDPQDWNRMAVVYLEIGNIKEALSMLKKLQMSFPYDEGTLHRLAICRYKMGNYVAAQDCYDRLLKIDPLDTVAGFYRRVCHKAVEGNPQKIEWMYHYEVPHIEALRRIRKINDMSRLTREELIAHWQQDEQFRAQLGWCLHLPDEAAKRSLLSMIASFGDAEAERMLRHFQLDQMQPESVKQDVFAMLKHMGAKEPYIAYLGGHLVQSRVSVRSVSKGNLPYAYQRALEICMQTMKEGRQSETIMEAVDIFQSFINGANALPQLRPQQEYAMAAALEYIACRNKEEEVTKTQVAARYGVTLLRLKNAINKIMRGISDKDKN